MRCTSGLMAGRCRCVRAFLELKKRGGTDVMRRVRQDITDFRPVANLLLFLVAVTFFLALGSFFAFHLYLASYVPPLCSRVRSVLILLRWRRIGTTEQHWKTSDLASLPRH